ncbi:uncharacterized protein Z518_06222 [Rhinocladiella mackenziei CBS 650.93]|uniref:Carbohydrate kinase PfkB domain-containing protein n=1 Tax=Rhinocladiella mackenziei CBS 650.93 TaxID=1442369 RepID=A0A0D2J8C9_9EURO|nr:uncharacterized protein Z518_06222 [Rhinocladiella mackenziei CBS 650.93]KIX05350.1 hypothetical protein Z518_06222 [Rhinocladiella mackenziei CBS 650.93]
MKDAHDNETLAFVTLGMFIIGTSAIPLLPGSLQTPTGGAHRLTTGADKIEYLDGTSKDKENIVGGAGTFAALGARLAAGIQHAKLVSWIVDMGSDFPPEFRKLIETWKTSCVFRTDRTRLTTTGWNGYGPGEFRAFKYLTPKRRLDEHSLADEQVLARSFHMVCSPTRCMALVNGIMERRRMLVAKMNTNQNTSDESLRVRPYFIWEPVPDLCTPEEFTRLRDAARHVDVVSPNAEEFAALFTSNPKCVTREDMVATFFGAQGQSLAQPGYLGDVALVIREGAQGCTTYLGTGADIRRPLHLRAYHRDSKRVVDPTGGGNTFLGALAIGMTGTMCPSPSEIETRLAVSKVPDSGLSQQRRLLFALIHATVAAGYAIEQTGMPVLSSTSTPTGEGEDNDTDEEVWNGEGYQERFWKYVERESVYIGSQFDEKQTMSSSIP